MYIPRSHCAPGNRTARQNQCPDFHIRKVKNTKKGKSRNPKKASLRKPFFKNVQSLPSHNLDKSRLLYPAKSRTIPQNLEQPRTISLITDPQRNPQYRTISNDLANHRPPTEPIILCYLAEISFSSTIESLLTPSPQGEGRRLWGPRREAAFDESPHSASRTLTQPGKRRINYPSPPWGGEGEGRGGPAVGEAAFDVYPHTRPH